QGILGPGLLLLGIYSAEPVQAALDRSKEARKRLLIPFKDTEHINAQWLSDRQDHEKKNENLQPTIDRHGRPLDFLTVEKGYPCYILINESWPSARRVPLKLLGSQQRVE